YMAPEQLRGERADERTDIHTFGAVLFEMSTGQRAFPQRSSAQLGKEILHNLPPRPRTISRTIPVQLEQIILKCLEKNADQRFQSASELGAELDELTKESKSDAHPRVGIASAIMVLLAVAVLVALKLGWFDRADHAPLAQAATRQITSNPMDDPVVKAAISPDGKYVVYTDLQGLHLRNVDSGETHSLQVPEDLCFR